MSKNNSKVASFSKAADLVGSTDARLDKIIQEARDLCEQTYGHIDRTGGPNLDNLPVPRNPYAGHERMTNGDQTKATFYDGKPNLAVKPNFR